MKFEELQAKSKSLSFVARNSSEEEGTYQIWSSRSDDEEMSRPVHGVIFAKHQGGQVDEKMVFEEFVDGGEGESEE